MTSGVVALVPVKDGAASIEATVKALLATGRVDRVVVVNDGSTDDSGARAVAAGAEVIELASNCGKGAALAVAVASTPDAKHYLLVDADTGTSSAAAVQLLDAVQAGDADLVIGVLPSAGGKGGFGVVKNLAIGVIRRGCGVVTKAPLSGQRAVKGEVLRRLTIAPKFGVEVAMTVDAARLGYRVREQAVEMDHDHRGRSVAGFAHRARQGADVLAVAATRLPTGPIRLAVAAVLAIGALLVGLAYERPGATALTLRQPLTVQAVPGATWDDVRALSPDAAASLAVAESDPLPTADLQSPTLAPDDAALARGPVLVMGTGTPGDKVLRPVLLFNYGSTGVLTSDATRRSGLITAGDIPNRMQVGGTLDIAKLRESQELVRFYDRAQPVFIGLLVAGLTVLYGAALLAARRRHPLSAAYRAASLVAAVPLATFVVRGLGLWATSSVWLWSALMATAVGIISVMAGRSGATLRKGESILDHSSALRRILLVTVILMLADLATGARLQSSGILGSSPSLGTRFYGLGNPAALILLTSFVVWAGLHLRAAISRLVALVQIALLALVITVFVGAPNLGADTGGVLAVAFTMVLTVLVLSGKTVRPTVALAATAIGAITLGAVALVDANRAAADQSHLGRLVNRVDAEGFAVIADAASRRAEANFLGYGFPWTVVAIAAAVFLVVTLWRGKRWTGVLPVGSYSRLTLACAMSGALALFAINDSGIVVLALTAITVAPLALVETTSKFLVKPQVEVQQA